MSLWGGAPSQQLIIISTPPPSGGGAVTLTANITWPDFTLAGTAKVVPALTANVTFPDFTLAGTMAVPVAASASITFPDFTLAGTAKVIPALTANITFPDFTLAGTVAVSGGAVALSANIIFPNFTLAGTAIVPVSCSLNTTFGDFTLVGTLFVPEPEVADTYKSFAVGLEGTAAIGGVKQLQTDLAVLVADGASPTQAHVTTVAADVAALLGGGSLGFAQAALLVVVDTSVVSTVSILNELFAVVLSDAAGSGMAK
jgi:hypothetical protein